ncbi:hypothetical protein B296_00033004 [Ensete ventricosum]|uniref:Longin domain-containing protein n=1 Tax=Ensete ventricosum TaxID=4639 RepID=A0A426XLF3_ENSVE|nr:hypothetical protein B296_00033004 [Ensete ventricosum]
MKITALLLLSTAGDCSSSSGPSDPVVLANASDVSHFGYFQRKAAKEFILFIARTVAKRTPHGQRQSVQHEGFLPDIWLHLPSSCQSKVHSYNRNGLCALAFMDDHYPVRSAFSLLNKSMFYLLSDNIRTAHIGKVADRYKDRSLPGSLTFRGMANPFAREDHEDKQAKKNA